MINKKIDKLEKEYGSICNSDVKLRSDPIRRLEEIAKFANNFDKFMISQGYAREITTSYDYGVTDDFWFQYDYFKWPIIKDTKPIIKDTYIGIAYRISADHFWIFSYKIGNKEREEFDLFKFLKGIKNSNKPINLTELLKDYNGKDLHLAITKDYSKVVGTGKTIEEAIRVAEAAGCKDFIIMRSPDNKA